MFRFLITLTTILLVTLTPSIRISEADVQGWAADPPDEWNDNKNKRPNPPPQQTEPTEPIDTDSIELHNYPWIQSKPRITKEKIVKIKRKEGETYQAHLAHDIHFTMKVKNRANDLTVKWSKGEIAHIKMYNKKAGWSNDIKTHVVWSEEDKHFLRIPQAYIKTTLTNNLTPGTESAHFRIRFNTKIKGIIRLGTSWETMNYIYIVKGTITIADIREWYKNPRDITGDNKANEKDLSTLLENLSTNPKTCIISPAPPIHHCSTAR